MKKLFLLLCVAAIALTGCKETTYSDETAELAGKYTGTFTLIKQNTEGSQSEAKQKTIIFKQNPLDMDNLLFEAVIEMIRTSDGIYELNKNSMTTSLLETALGYFNVEQYVGGAIDKINDISAKAVFTDNTVSLKFYYDIQIAGAEAQIVIATFNGTKQ